MSLASVQQSPQRQSVAVVGNKVQKEFYLTSLFLLLLLGSCITMEVTGDRSAIETTLHFVYGAVATETKHLIYHIRLTLFAAINVCERI